MLAAAGCARLGQNGYQEPFAAAGGWGEGETSEVAGRVEGGVYDLLVKKDYGLFLSTAGRSFGDGVFELDATQVEGPLNNGYGLALRVEDASNTFYAFEVSGDGFVWVGRCANLCNDEAMTLLGDDWLPSPAVKQGLQQTNHLRVVAEGELMTFYVNDILVGRASDGRLTQGDIGVMVETLGEGGVRVAFDNVSVAPLAQSEAE